MNDDRSAVITLADREYTLTLTVRATKEIAKRYGGLSDLGDKLMKNESPEDALDEVVWLIVLLVNQSIERDNMINHDDKPLISCDMVELLTTPRDLIEYKNAIMASLINGTRRDVESAPEAVGDSKNAESAG